MIKRRKERHFELFRQCLLPEKVWNGYMWCMNGVIEVDIKSALLSLLQDEEVKSQVLQIVKSEFGKKRTDRADDNDRELRLENEALKKEVAQLKEQLEKSKNSLQAEIEQRSRTEEELDGVGKELKQCCLYAEQLKSKVEPASELLDLWEKIQYIPEGHKTYFNGLAGSEDMMAYFSIGRDISKMRQLQKYIQDIAVEDAEEEQTINTLNEFLCLCIKIGNYAKASSEKLKKIHIDIGQEFDLNTCIKTSSSGNNGYISQVLIQGFCNQEGKTIFSSIVRLL